MFHIWLNNIFVNSKFARGRLNTKLAVIIFGQIFLEQNPFEQMFERQDKESEKDPKLFEESLRCKITDLYLLRGVIY